MILTEHFTLSNGIAIPKIGFGTWMIKDTEAAGAVIQGIETGYRHIDTAQAYGNESGVGKGIANSGVDRSNLFITTKLDAGIKFFDAAVAAIDQSLQKLGLDYIDLMIIHSPKPWDKFLGNEPYFEGNKEAWRALEQACRDGKLRSIGVSNFERQDLDNILSSCTIKPVVNQILAHISNTPFELIDYCQKNDILVEAYSPIGHGELLRNDEVRRMADKYHVSIAQLGVRYCVQLGLLPLPKTTNPKHMKTNAEVDFVIAESDMAFLKNMKPIEDYGEASKYAVFGKVQSGKQ